MTTFLTTLQVIVMLTVPASAQGPAGDWTGNIQIPGRELYVEVQLEAGATWSGLISIPAQRGVTVIRYDKRTFVYKAKSAPDPARLTVNDEVVEDAARIVALAATFPEVDAKRIFLLGTASGA